MTDIIFRLLCNLFNLCCINLCKAAKHWDSFLSDCITLGELLHIRKQGQTLLHHNMDYTHNIISGLHGLLTHHGRFVEVQRGKRWSTAEYRPVSKNWSAQVYKIHYLYI